MTYTQATYTLSPKFTFLIYSSSSVDRVRRCERSAMSSGGKQDGAAAAGEEERKTSWPEVVGLPVEEAKKVILKDMSDADIVVVPVGTPVTKDFRPNRVRIFVDTVAGTPTIG